MTKKTRRSHVSNSSDEFDHWFFVQTKVRVKLYSLETFEALHQVFFLSNSSFFFPKHWKELDFSTEFLHKTQTDTWCERHPDVVHCLQTFFFLFWDVLIPYISERFSLVALLNGQIIQF